MDPQELQLKIKKVKDGLGKLVTKCLESGVSLRPKDTVPNLKCWAAKFAASQLAAAASSQACAGIDTLCLDVARIFLRIGRLFKNLVFHEHGRH